MLTSLTFICYLPEKRGSEASMSKETTALMDAEVSTYRLPRSVVPERYEIKLEPDLKGFTFEGEELINLTIAEPVRQIIINSLELEIDSVSISNNNNENLKAKISFDVENERAIFSFSELLKAGSWKLAIKFKGTLNDKLHGFYRS